MIKIQRVGQITNFISMLLLQNSLNKININVVNYETLSGEGSILPIDNDRLRGRVPGKSNYS